MYREAVKGRCETISRAAVSWMTERNVLPTPENYEVVYTYISGDHAELKRNVDDLVANGSRFDANIMKMLHQRYFFAAESGSAFSELGKKLATELDSLLESLATAGNDQSAYGQLLSKTSGELGQAEISEAVLKTMIHQVSDATRAMQSRTRTLELQLLISSREVGELRERFENVRRESLTDQLTGLANRRSFDADLAASIENAVKTGEPLSLIMCDIDKFKAFNDTWGHQTGDQVLRLLASCLAENVKGRDTAARFGGEEFVVILPQTALSAAAILADQIRRSVETKKLVKKSTGDILGSITISAGVAQFDANETAVDLLRRADACLYAAKHAGRNCVVSDMADPPS